MKSARQMAILDIINRLQIGTQEELAAALQAEGFRTTQATVSRDIRELGLRKVAVARGGWRYAPPEEERSELTDRFIRILSDSLVSAASSGALVVVKTLSGSAGAACQALDSLGWPEVLGTLAGDNTILLVARSAEDGLQLVERLHGMMHV